MTIKELYEEAVKRGCENLDVWFEWDAWLYEEVVSVDWADIDDGKVILSKYDG